MLTISPIRFNNSQPPTLHPTQRKSPSFGIAYNHEFFQKVAQPATGFVKDASPEFRKLVSNAANHFNKKIFKEAINDQGYRLSFYAQPEWAKIPTFEIADDIIKIYDHPCYHGLYKEGYANSVLSRIMTRTLGIAHEPGMLDTFADDAERIVDKVAEKKLTRLETTIMEHLTALNTKKIEDDTEVIQKVIAEIIASHQKGGGLFGSGLFVDKDPKVMQKLFPGVNDLIELVYFRI